MTIVFVLQRGLRGLISAREAKKWGSVRDYCVESVFTSLSGAKAQVEARCGVALDWHTYNGHGTVHAAEHSFSINGGPTLLNCYLIAEHELEGA